MQKKRFNRSGFTLVELVIVVAVIGILASITVVGYNTVQYNAKLSKSYTVVKNYQSALKLIGLNEGLPNYYVNFCLGPPSIYSGNPGTCSMAGQSGNTDTAFNTQLRNKGLTTQPAIPFDDSITTQTIMYNFVYYGNYHNLMYTLKGDKADCGVQPVISADSSGNWGANGAKYTTSNGGYTFCLVGIDA